MNAVLPTQRWSAPRISVFNHKGGVGKTTLTVNIAFAMAALGKRVLLVDSDPQANLTSYLIEDAVVDSLLDESDEPDGQTVWSAVKPVSEGIGAIKMIEPIERSSSLFLLSGDIRLAEFEEQLSNFWSECLKRRIHGFRGTCALSTLVDQVAREIGADLVFYDSGPNIGPLNRVILLDCDFFLIPAAADLFSLRAIKTLGHAMAAWIRESATISELAPTGAYLLPGMPRLLGYIPQRFKVYGGTAASDSAGMFPRIERAVQEDVLTVLTAINPVLGTAAPSPLRIGEVKEFGALANASQQQGVPMSEVDAGTAQQRAAAGEAFTSIATVILRKIAGAVGHD